MENASKEGLVALEQIRELAALMKEFDLCELEVRRGDAEVRLAKGSFGTDYRPAPVAPASPSPATVTGSPAHDTESRSIVYFKSPMIGTYYSRPNPNSEPFVKIGDFVDPERTICIIEAMKVFNEIPAEVRGRIVAVLVGDEEPVDFGKPLFKIDTAG